jgi:hypothetical protein
LSDPNDTSRIAKLKELVKMDYNEALTFTWRADAPFGVSKGGSKDFVLHIGGSSDYWWPDAVWKPKK